jgi:hypothetical protein
MKLIIAIFLYPFLLMAQAPAPSPTPVEQKPPAAVAAKPYPAMSPAAKTRVREIYEYLAHSKPSMLYAAFSPGMKKNSSVANLSAATRQLAGLGVETKLVSEIYQPSLLGAGTHYSRVAHYSKAKKQVLVTLGIDEDGLLTAMQFGELPEAPPDPSEDYKTKAKLHLPFKGDWMVYQGGRSVAENSFVMNPESRHAVVFVPLKDGRPFATDGKTNEDYFCFGQPVLAPADGTIVQVQNNYPDSQPGKPILEIGKGNYVVISHGQSEFSVVSSLKQGSITQQRGAKVKAGDVVGRCGNSGTAAVPHLEYRLQSTRGVPDPSSLPAQFVEYIADGKPVPLGEPTRGQMVANAPAAQP